MRFFPLILLLCGCNSTPVLPPLPPLPPVPATKATVKQSLSVQPPKVGTLSWDFAYDADNTPSNIVFLVFSKPALDEPWMLLATTANLSVQFTTAAQGFFKAQTSNTDTGKISP